MSWFQYPQADRRGCNQLPWRGCPTRCFCFSIHKRIEGGATLFPFRRKNWLISFQYPQADRRGCNYSRAGDGRVRDEVSVSTSGSKGVQHLYTADNPDKNCSFSIHKRIEGGATIHLIPICCCARNVSVSTSGSKGVQLNNAYK